MLNLNWAEPKEGQLPSNSTFFDNHDWEPSQTKASQLKMIDCNFMQYSDTKLKRGSRGTFHYHLLSGLDEKPF